MKRPAILSFVVALLAGPGCGQSPRRPPSAPPPASGCAVISLAPPSLPPPQAVDGGTGAQGPDEGVPDEHPGEEHPTDHPAPP